MASEIKVDTISEKTSANGVAIDGLTIKDGGLGGHDITFADGAYDFDIASHDTSNGLKLGGTLVTATAAELNIMDGVTATAAEINLIDGGTSRGTTALADGDGILINDAGTMRMTNVTAVKTYMSTSLDGIDDQTSSNDDQLTITDSAVIINEDSDDLDFRVETNGNANRMFINGGDDTVLFGTATTQTCDDAYAVQIFGTTNAEAGLLITRNSANNGYPNLSFGKSRSTSPGGGTIVQDNDQLGRIAFHADDGGDMLTPGAAIDAQINGTPGANDMPTALNFRTTADSGNDPTLTLHLSSGQQLATGAEQVPDVDAGGICLDQNASDAKIMSLKSSDIAHGITSQAETDTYAFLQKYSATEGGLAIQSFSETGVALELKSFVGQGEADDTKSTSAAAVIIANAFQHNGSAGVELLPSNDNLFIVANAGAAKFIVDIEGELHSDGGAQSAYDEYDDAQLIRACDLSRGKGTIDSKFDKFIAYNHEHLADLQLVGREEDGTPNHFINVTGMQRLHNGAIWQQYEKHQRLLEAVYDLAKEAVGEEKANAILDKHEIKRLQ